MESAEELESVDPEATDFLMGIFSAGHHNLSSAMRPTLSDMTKKALQILSKAIKIKVPLRMNNTFCKYS